MTFIKELAEKTVMTKFPAGTYRNQEEKDFHLRVMKEKIEEAMLSLLQKVREGTKEKEYKHAIDSSKGEEFLTPQFVDGWNACREEFIKNINEIEHETKI